MLSNVSGGFAQRPWKENCFVKEINVISQSVQY